MSLVGTLAVMLISLFVLEKSAKWTITSAVKLARFFKISDLAVGFILVAVATSFPELFVSVVAAAHGQIPIAVGNVFGSNIANLMIILGITAIIANNIKVSIREIKELYPILFITSLLPLIMLLNVFSSYYGIGLLAIFMIFVHRTLKKKIKLEGEETVHVSSKEAVFAAFIFTIAVAIVITSSNFVVESAITLSDILKLSKTFIGATVVAVGTSLPELSVSLAALKDKKFGLALGNVFGSCITNLTLVLGAAIFIQPLAVINFLAFLNVIIFMLIANLVTGYFLQMKGKLNRSHGVIFIGVYILFILSEIQVEMQGFAA